MQALEAAIAADCDDPEPYLVYADWLQSRGDPRGTWIALSVAADRGNTEAASEAAMLFTYNRRHLLGELAQRNDVEVEWYQGFVRTIRFRYFAWHQLRDALRAMLATPACAVVQHIAIESVEPADRVVDFLLEHRAPQTLAHLQIGKPSEWSFPAELVAAFPRLAGDPVAAWEAAVAAARTQRRLTIDVDLAALPPLEMRPGMAAVEPSVVLAGLKAEVEHERPIGMLRALPNAVTRASLDEFSLVLAQQDIKWAWECVGALGGDRTAIYLGEQFRVFRHARAVQALGYLQRIATDVAACELVRLTWETPAIERARAASDALEMFALARDVESIAQLIARTCPRGRLGERYRGLQQRWLDDLMISGDRIPAADFLAHVVDHPHRDAGAYVWGVFEGPVGRDRVVSMFRTSALPDLPAGARIGVVHPAEVAPEERAALGFERPVFTTTEDTPYLDLPPVRVERLLGRGWHTYRDHDFVVRRFRRDNVLVKVSAESDGTRVSYHRASDWIDRSFAELHPVTVSEILLDLDAIARRPPRARRARPSSRPAARERAP